MRDGIPQFIGAEVRRREDPELITGGGKFVADIAIEGAATMAFVQIGRAHV